MGRPKCLILMTRLAGIESAALGFGGRHLLVQALRRVALVISAALAREGLYT